MTDILRKKIEKIKSKGKESYSMDDWVVALFSVYQDVDVERSGAELWLQVLDEASKLMEAIRKEELMGVTKQCVKVFGWTASFVGKYTLSRPAGSDPIGDGLARSSREEF